MKTNPKSISASFFLLLAVVAGCGEGRVSSTIPEPVDLPEVQALREYVGDRFEGFILATGRIEPLGGVVAVIGPVGDRVQSIDVAVDQDVEVDEDLGRFAGQSMREAELEVASIQLEEAEAKLAAEQSIGEAQLATAKIAVRTQQLRLEEAQAEKARASREGGTLTLLDGKIRLEQSMLEKLQAASSQATSPPLVSATAVQQQELALQGVQTEFESVKRQLDSSIEMAQLMLESAQQEVVALERKLESSESSISLRSLRKKKELLEMQRDLNSLKSPIRGRVLAIDATPGQATSGVSVIRIADLSTIVCRAEVPSADLSAIQEGAEAAVTGGGLSRPLRGKIRAIGTLHGSPRLPNAIPGARNDWNAFQVEIEIDANDREMASKFIHAQVDVAIKSTKPEID